MRKKKTRGRQGESKRERQGHLAWWPYFCSISTIATYISLSFCWVMKSYDSQQVENKKWELEGQARWAMVAKVECRKFKQHQHFYLLGLRAGVSWTPQLEPLDYIAVLPSSLNATYKKDNPHPFFFCFCPAFFRLQETNGTGWRVYPFLPLFCFCWDIFVCAMIDAPSYAEEKKKERCRFGCVGIGYRWWYVLPFFCFYHFGHPTCALHLFFLLSKKHIALIHFALSRSCLCSERE